MRCVNCGKAGMRIVRIAGSQNICLKGCNNRINKRRKGTNDQFLKKMISD